MDTRFTRLTRREFVIFGLGVSASLGLAACGGSGGDDNGAQATATSPAAGPTALAPSVTPPDQARARTPACGDDDDVTPEQTEGPYFTPDSPERASLLESGMPGERLAISGLVLSTACAPIANALLDFWQADSEGIYDNEGYTLRGHQFTDANGRFSLQTVVPGLYPGRTRHVHVKVQAPDQPVLTTQLYFPGEPGNQTDGIFSAELLMDVQDAPDGKQALFDFVLEIA